MATTRIGQLNGSGDELTLFKDIFTGEVLAAYEQATILDNIVMKKTIKNGKSASFKNTSKVNGGRHTVGTIVTGSNNFKVAETVINVEPRVYTDEQLSEIDELMNDFDARSAISKAMGEYLANQKDTDRIKEIIKGARASNEVDGLPGGTSIVNADLASSVVATKAQALKDSIFDGVQALKEKNVTGEIYVLLRPEDYLVLSRDTEVINSDYVSKDNGGLDNGKVLMVAGAKILMSNNLVQEDSTVSDFYHGVDASNVYGIMFTKDSVATVNLKDISFTFDPIVGGFGELITSSYIAGHKYLRPEACVEFVSA